jgi:hypothetical protein
LHLVPVLIAELDVGLVLVSLLGLRVDAWELQRPDDEFADQRGEGLLQRQTVLRDQAELVVEVTEALKLPAPRYPRLATR